LYNAYTAYAIVKIFLWNPRPSSRPLQLGLAIRVSKKLMVH